MSGSGGDDDGDGGRGGGRGGETARSWRDVSGESEEEEVGLSVKCDGCMSGACSLSSASSFP